MEAGVRTHRLALASVLLGGVVHEVPEATLRQGPGRDVGLVRNLHPVPAPPRSGPVTPHRLAEQVVRRQPDLVIRAFFGARRRPRRTHRRRRGPQLLADRRRATGSSASRRHLYRRHHRFFDGDLLHLNPLDARRHRHRCRIRAEQRPEAEDSRIDHQHRDVQRSQHAQGGRDDSQPPGGGTARRLPAHDARGNQRRGGQRDIDEEGKVIPRASPRA